MTSLTRWALGLALVGALAAAPAAQGYPDDADHPGAPIVRTPAPGVADVDDRDPGWQRQPAPASVADPVDDRDAPRAGYTLALDPTVLRAEVDSPWSGAAAADDGRSSFTPGPRPVAATVGSLDLRAKADLPSGRAEGPLRASTFRVAYDGPLDDGRPEGTRPAAVLDADGLDVAAFAAPGLEAPPPEGLRLEAVRPNPVDGPAVLAFAADARSRATVTVYDVRGRVVAVAFDGVVEPGLEAQARFDASDVAPGTYVAVLAVGERRLSRTFQVVR